MTSNLLNFLDLLILNLNGYKMLISVNDYRFSIIKMMAIALEFYTFAKKSLTRIIHVEKPLYRCIGG